MTPRFDLGQGETTTLIVSATGCQALQVTVCGIPSTGGAPLMDSRVRAARLDGVRCEQELTWAQLEPFDALQVDPVLYGHDGQAYRLEVAVRGESDGAPRILATVTGILERSRMSDEPSATGSDAPLITLELAKHYRAARGWDTGEDTGEHTGAHSIPIPAPSAGAGALDNLDLSKDFSLGAPPPQPADGAKRYPVWYGTNRTPALKDGTLIDYSAFRDKAVHYGRCTVRIPKSHRIGETGSPFWKRILTLTDDRLTVETMLELERAAFWRGVADQLAGADVGNRHAVVFIHGYNVSFTEAAIRAAQLGCDLGIEGVMAFYSWPSRGTFDGYFADESTVQASAKYITQFLQDVVENAGAEQVHVIAHSMGNRAALEAVREMVARVQERTRVPFSQFILAAPDVDAEYFLQFAEAYERIAKRTTMYVSDRDHAVRASRFLHGGVARVGLAPPFQVVTGIDTVYAGKVDDSTLGHGYVAGAWQLLNDMHQMIHLDAEPQKRAWVKRSESDDHWVLEGVV